MLQSTIYMVNIEVTPELIMQVAKNSALELTEQEVAQFTKDFEDVLKNFEKVSQAKTSNKPSFHPIPTTLFSKNYREDVPGDVLSVEEALKNVEDKTESKHIRGPKVV